MNCATVISEVVLRKCCPKGCTSPWDGESYWYATENCSGDTSIAWDCTNAESPGSMLVLYGHIEL